MELPAYDQRWITRATIGFRARSGNVCVPCGAQNLCPIKDARLIECPIYSLVMSFKDNIGLDRLFNTFRRGAGWHKRLQIRDRVRLYIPDIEEFVGRAEVVETQSGPLGCLLEQHAAFNHTLRDGNYPDADMRLLKTLVKLYGRNYTTLDTVFSVIYLDPKVNA